MKNSANQFKGMFQDAEGTIPVTKVGDPVGLVISPPTMEKIIFESAVTEKWSDSYIFNLEASGRYVDEILEAMFWAWQASRQALDSCEPVAYDMGDEIYGENSGDMNDYIRQNGRPLVYADTHPASAVPEGWKISLHADGVTVLFPGTRGGVHVTTDSPNNDIADNVLHDLALALICGPKLAERPSLGRRKAEEVGTTIGVLVQRDDGKVAAVTDLGRCTWLSQDVTGPSAGVTCIADWVKGAKKYNVRGFQGYKQKDLYGHEYSIQKSSLATENCIWFGVNDAAPVVMASDAKRLGVSTDETCGWVPFPVPVEVSMHTRMHLSQRQVRDLLPVLQCFADSGDLPEPPKQEQGQ